MKLYILDYGEMTVDQGWVFSAGGTSTFSQIEPSSIRKNFKMIGALIEHPDQGLILYEAGPAPNYAELWPNELFEAFPVTKYTEENRLDNILKQKGYTLQDISAIILGHLHFDHAGGLEFFRGMNVPVYVHKEELKNSFYAVATKEDYGAFLPHYLDSSFNWQSINEDQTTLFKDIKLYKTPGHTPGCMSMKIKLPNSGNFLFTSDTVVLRENYESSVPQGWLTRDFYALSSSLKKIRNIAENKNARLVFGHDPDVLAELKQPPEYYD